MDLRRLHLLRELRELGTIHATATALGYSTSAVSRQLAVLEREVGAAVLEKVGRNVRLTPVGELLAARADVLLAEAEAAEAAVAEVTAGRLAGVVRVAGFQSAVLRIVAPAVRALAVTHPDITVEVTEAEVEQSVPALRLQHLDLLIGDEYAEQPRPVYDDLNLITLLREQINLVLPEDHPAASGAEVVLRDLADTPWAACQPGTGHHQMHLRVCRQLGGFEPRIRHTSDDFVILLELARATGSAALLPELIHPQDAPGVVVRELAHGSVERHVYVQTRRGTTPTVAAVVDALRAASAGG
ncbi:LysR family transcriptional regulator [Nocardioides sp. URHA0032]|uniref:LysR family transcriptional regulator n=1 Tax=Nocardioides sp. URHA0032 TaxID=1380388 RepID=UPI001E2F081A|nr:LysR family transcriptional regulator [Nocardioides sp. URHA0032]